MPERAALDAVVFDIGGTLVRLDFEWMSEALAALGHAVDAAGLRRAEVEGRRHYDRSHGRHLTPGERHPPLGTHGDVHAYFGGMLEAAGVPPELRPPAQERFLARQRETTGLWARPMEGARGTLDALGAMGLRRAAVSNSDGRAEAHLVSCGVRDGIEFVVDSQLVGVEKPDPGIFRIALERLGLPPERTLYVGDIRSVDEAGSHAAGMHFVLLDPHGDYAGPETPAIPDIATLPDWVRGRFRLPEAAARRPGGGGAR